MDYPLGGKDFSRVGLPDRCLNPYSNGLPSRGWNTNPDTGVHSGLNPYSNGLPSRGKDFRPGDNTPEES